MLPSKQEEIFGFINSIKEKQNMSRLLIPDLHNNKDDEDENIRRRRMISTPVKNTKILDYSSRDRAVYMNRNMGDKTTEESNVVIIKGVSLLSSEKAMMKLLVEEDNEEEKRASLYNMHSSSSSSPPDVKRYSSSLSLVDIPDNILLPDL